MLGQIKLFPLNIFLCDKSSEPFFADSLRAHSLWNSTFWHAEWAQTVINLDNGVCWIEAESMADLASITKVMKAGSVSVSRKNLRNKLCFQIAGRDANQCFMFASTQWTVSASSWYIVLSNCHWGQKVKEQKPPIGYVLCELEIITWNYIDATCESYCSISAVN